MYTSAFSALLGININPYVMLAVLCVCLILFVIIFVSISNHESKRKNHPMLMNEQEIETESYISKKEREAKFGYHKGSVPGARPELSYIEAEGQGMPKEIVMVRETYPARMQIVPEAKSAYGKSGAYKRKTPAVSNPYLDKGISAPFEKLEEPPLPIAPVLRPIPDITSFRKPIMNEAFIKPQTPVAAAATVKTVANEAGRNGAQRPLSEPKPAMSSPVSKLAVADCDKKDKYRISVYQTPVRHKTASVSEAPAKKENTKISVTETANEHIDKTIVEGGLKEIPIVHEPKPQEEVVVTPAVQEDTAAQKALTPHEIIAMRISARKGGANAPGERVRLPEGQKVSAAEAIAYDVLKNGALSDERPKSKAQA